MVDMEQWRRSGGAVELEGVDATREPSMLADAGRCWQSAERSVLREPQMPNVWSVPRPAAALWSRGLCRRSS
jgi:hypothetical protein